jgi:hypothetical protein
VGAETAAHQNGARTKLAIERVDGQGSAVARGYADTGALAAAIVPTEDDITVDSCRHTLFREFRDEPCDDGCHGCQQSAPLENLWGLGNWRTHIGPRCRQGASSKEMTESGRAAGF